MTDGRSAKGGGRSRVSLSRDSIIEAAMRMTKEQPTTPLTLARLGAELSADPTALYRHFRSRDELIREMGDRLFGETMETLDLPDDWQAALVHIADQLRAVMLERPALAADLGLRFTGGANERSGVAVIGDVLRRGGFDEAVVLHHTRAFGEFMLAQIVMSAAMLCLPPDEQEFELRVSRSLYGPDGVGSPRQYEDHLASTIVATYVAGLAAQLEQQSRTVASANMIQHERGDQ